MDGYPTLDISENLLVTIKKSSHYRSLPPILPHYLIVPPINVPYSFNISLLRLIPTEKL